MTTIETLLARVQDYLGNGGFFNPEMMDHWKVRVLVIDMARELRRVATQVSPPTPKIASDRKGLLYLASRFADLARGVDEPDPEPDDEHDPETCDVCAKIADELTVLITNELRYAEALSSPPPEPGERT